MKYLLPPAIAVGCSTAGTAYGCHAAGMSPRDVVIATALAACVSSAATFVALFLVRSRRTAPVRTNPIQPS